MKHLSVSLADMFIVDPESNPSQDGKSVIHQITSK